MAHYVGILEGKGKTWSIRVPDLRGCHGGGRSASDAITNTIVAMQDWAESVTGDGFPVPPARDVEAIMKDRNAEFDPAAGESLVILPLIRETARNVRANLSIDAGMLEAIDAEAKLRGLTRSAFLVSAARDKIEQRR